MSERVIFSTSTIEWSYDTRGHYLPKQEVEFRHELNSPEWRTGADGYGLEKLLSRAIPKGECDRIRRKYKQYGDIYSNKETHPTGGSIYEGDGSDVATYNNTRADKEEILAWLQRALELTL